MESKICSTCKMPRTVDMFHDQSSGPLGKKSSCKVCVSELNATAEKTKRRYKLTVARRYKLTVEQYEKIKQDQNNLCAICKKIPDSAFHLDHDHETGQIREFLCHRCNMSLGLIKEDIETLKSMIRYLEYHLQKFETDGIENPSITSENLETKIN